MRTRRPFGVPITGQLTAVALVALLAALAPCCSDGGEGGDGAVAGRSDSTAGTPATTGAARVTPECEEGTFEQRRYILCLAADRNDQGLVVALHGRGLSIETMQGGTGLERVAANEGWAVVYPQGIDRAWGDDTFTSSGRPAGNEDIVFLDGLVDELRRDPHIADGPVGVVGFSNGACMALRYASERPEDVQGVVAVAGQLPRDPAIRPTGRVPLLQIYGTADPIRSHETGLPEAPGRQPGDPTPTLSTADTVAAFVATARGPVEHEVPEEIDPEPGDGTTVRTERWSDDEGAVAVLRTVIDGGHTWPSARDGYFRDDRGPVSQDIDASADAIAFLLDPEAVT